MLATFAFDVCHEVYLAAREAIDAKIPTLSPESCGKYQWRPDRLPRMAEYVCDFARAGERALGGSAGSKGREGTEGSEGRRGRGLRDDEIAHALRVGSGRVLAGSAHDSFSTGGSRDLLGASHSYHSLRASRLVMFRVYYLAGADYHAARRHLGISEFTWADWAEEIRRLVGRELTRGGVFPPSRYFHQASEKAS